MLTKIVNGLKKDPLSHLAAIASLVSLFSALGAWQYSKGYFKTLGIPISYSPLDNLVFLFDQATRVSMSDQPETRFSYLYSGFTGMLVFIALPFSCMALWRRFGATEKLKGQLLAKPGEKKLDDFGKKYWTMFFVWLLISVTLSQVLAMRVDNNVSLLLIALILFRMLWGYFKDLFRAKPELESVSSVQVGALILLFFGGAFILGKLDAKRALDSGFAFLDSACLSAPAKELSKDAPEGWVVCGKIAHMDSSRICLKEEFSDVINCRQRDKYEIAVIAN